MTNLCTQFISHVEQLNLFGQNDKLLLAVSGGLDSIVLVALCEEAGCRYEIAHANFQLRDKESDEDEELVRRLAAQHGVKLHVRKFETGEYAENSRMGIQPAARQLRYSWFADLLLSENAKVVVTAHHRDDNIETAVFNFFRGTGISGVRGMLAKQNNIVRPLLIFSKMQLREHADLLSLGWREDASNQSNKYSRNFIRNELLPKITTIIPEAEKNVSANIDRFLEVEELYNQAITGYRKKLLKQVGNEYQIPIEALRRVRPLNSIVYELCQPFGFTSAQVSEIMKLMDATQGSFLRSNQYRIIRNRKWLIIASAETKTADFVVIEKDESRVELPAPFDCLKQHSINGDKIDLNTDHFTALVDAGELEYPLIFRKWKPGDYFYPLGMSKKKKLSRFFIDQKLSPVEKEKVYVLQSGKRICWIVGLRLDDRFKVKANSKVVMMFRVD